MSTPIKTDPPSVPLRHGGWPVHRAPRWLLVAGVLVLAGAVLVGLAIHDLPTAIHIASYGASNCSPANNELLDDLVQYQVSESLASFGLPRAVNGLVTWAFPDAQRVQDDVAGVLQANGAARAAATVKLHRDLRTLDAQRVYVNKIMMKAVTATAATGKLPVLPG
jgi:hypothetical protein